MVREVRAVSPDARARLALHLREIIAILEEAAPEDREAKPRKRRKAPALPIPPSGKPVDPATQDRARFILRARGVPTR